MTEAVILTAVILLILWFLCGRLFILNRKESKKDAVGTKTMEKLIISAVIIGTVCILIPLILKIL